MLKKLFITIIFLTGSLFLNCEASGTQIHKDEGAENDAFKAFEEQLLKAVKTHDVGFIKSILDPKIILSYPDDENKIRKSGILDFMSQWNPDKECSPLWNTLSAILSVGGVFADKEKQQYVMPYIHSLWPKDVDPLTYSAIVGKDINIRAEPDLSASVISQLSYDIVKVDNRFVHDKWQKITIPDGREGYVFGEFIRSKYDWSAGFAKVGGEWKMKWFVAKGRDRRLPDPPPVTDTKRPMPSMKLLPPGGGDNRQYSHE